MYEIHGLTKRLEILEREMQSALQKIDHLEALLREEERQIKKLSRDVAHEHEIIERIEHGIPVGL